MPISLDEPQQELVAEEARHFAQRVQNPAAQEVYQRLHEEAAHGEVADELAEPLGELLKLGLTSGRIRSRYGAHSEMAATRLLRRTPQGEALQAQFKEANGLLKTLQGQEIQNVTLSARGPGLYTLTLETKECRVVAALDPSGVDVRSVEVAL